MKDAMRAIDDCKVCVSQGSPWGRLDSSGQGEFLSMVITFQGLGFYTLRCLEASEVAGIWGNSRHLSSVNTAVLIQPLTVRVQPSSGCKSHVHEPRSRAVFTVGTLPWVRNSV